MRLTRLHVKSFESVRDSTPFDIQDVTCLVGKNESAKTGILQRATKRRRFECKDDGHTSGRIERTEWQRILETLKQCHWVVAGANGAASRLGMNRSTLEVRMRKLGISRRSA